MKVHVIVSPATSRIATAAFGASMVAVLAPAALHVRPLSTHPGGTSSRTVHGGSPVPVAAR